MKTAKIVFGVLFSAMLGLSACGGDNCSRGPKCSAEAKATEADIKTCQEQAKTLMMDACQGAAQNLGDCGYSSTVCTADNKTDAAKSEEKFNSSCSSQQQELTKCCQANPSSKLCGGSAPTEQPEVPEVSEPPPEE